MCKDFQYKRDVLVILISISTLFSLNAQDLSLDKKLGADGKKTVESTMGFYNDTAKSFILEKLGDNLANHLNNKLFDYQFFIVDMGEPNAFALPGGYIFFTRGILALANNEDELAGVMGHEIIHSNNRHSIKQVKTGILSGILSLPEAIAGAFLGENAGKIFSPITKGGEAINASYSRKDEKEADKLGVILSANSGYDPAALGLILKNLNQTVEVFTGKKEEPSYFSTHPLTADRIEKINKESAKLEKASEPKIFKNNKEFLGFLDGLMVGPNPKQGVFQGNAFIHPELNFRFDVPEDWLKENTTSVVAAGDTSGSAVVMLEIESKYKSADTAANAYAAEIQKKTGKTVEVGSKNINGCNTKSISFEGNDKDKVIKFDVYWIEYNNLLYKFTGAAAAGSGFENMVTESIESFSKPSDEEIHSITMKLLKVVETLNGETLQTLSARVNNILSPELTAAINSFDKEKVFSDGELVKIVVKVSYVK